MKLQNSTFSQCVAFGLLALCWQGPTLADTDLKKRHRLVFKMLTSGKDYLTKNTTGFESADINKGNDVPVKIDVLNRTNTVEYLKGKTEPPLISGGKLTLTMLGKFKKTWCKTEPFMQLVKEPGCLSRKVLNRFCYGQCNSLYIPRTIRKRTKRKVFKSCGFCKPKRTHTIRVTLRCPGRKREYITKKIKQIKQCRCMER